MGAFASGLLNSYTEKHHQQNLMDLQDESERRKALSQNLQKLAFDPEVRPEHRDEYLRQLGILHDTDLHKKLPKDIGNLNVELPLKQGKSLNTPNIPAPVSTVPPVSMTIPGVPAENNAQLPPGAQGPELNANLPEIPAQQVTSQAPYIPQAIEAPLPPNIKSGPFMSPEEQGQRIEKQQRPVEEAKAKRTLNTKIEEFRTEQALKREDEKKELEFLNNMEPEERQNYLIMKGKGGMIVPKAVNVLLKDGTQVQVSKVAMPGNLDKFYDKDGVDISSSVQRITGTGAVKNEIIKDGDIPVGIRDTSGKEWYGNEPGIPKEIASLLTHAQEASEKQFGRRTLMQANANAYAMARAAQAFSNKQDAGVQNLANKSSDDARKAYETLKDSIALSKQKTPRADLGLVFNAVRSMVAGAGRMTNVELEKELKTGSFPDRVKRWFSIASTGLLPDDQRNQLLDLVKANYETKKDIAGEQWDSAYQGSKKRPPHLIDTPEAKGSSPPVELPEEALKSLKEDHVTTFGNGQEWTLENGKPKRLK